MFSFRLLVIYGIVLRVQSLLRNEPQAGTISYRLRYIGQSPRHQLWNFLSDKNTSSTETIQFTPELRGTRNSLVQNNSSQVLDPNHNRIPISLATPIEEHELKLKMDNISIAPVFFYAASRIQIPILWTIKKVKALVTTERSDEQEQDLEYSQNMHRTSADTPDVVALLKIGPAFKGIDLILRRQFLDLIKRRITVDWETAAGPLDMFARQRGRAGESTEGVTLIPGFRAEEMTHTWRVVENQGGVLNSQRLSIKVDPATSRNEQRKRNGFRFFWETFFLEDFSVRAPLGDRAILTAYESNFLHNAKIFGNEIDDRDTTDYNAHTPDHMTISLYMRKIAKSVLNVGQFLTNGIAGVEQPEETNKKLKKKQKKEAANIIGNTMLSENIENGQTESSLVEEKHHSLTLKAVLGNVAKNIFPILKFFTQFRENTDTLELLKADIPDASTLVNDAEDLGETIQAASNFTERKPKDFFFSFLFQDGFLTERMDQEDLNLISGNSSTSPEVGVEKSTKSWWSAPYPSDALYDHMGDYVPSIGDYVPFFKSSSSSAIEPTKISTNEDVAGVEAEQQRESLFTLNQNIKKEPDFVRQLSIPFANSNDYEQLFQEKLKIATAAACSVTLEQDAGEFASTIGVDCLLNALGHPSVGQEVSRLDTIKGICSLVRRDRGLAGIVAKDENAMAALVDIMSAPASGWRTFKSQADRDKELRLQREAVALIQRLVRSSDEAVDELRQDIRLLKSLSLVASDSSWVEGSYNSEDTESIKEKIAKEDNKMKRVSADLKWNTTIDDYRHLTTAQMARVSLWGLGGMAWQPKVPNQKGIRILSLDGGGTKGVCSVAILKELLERANKTRPSEMFDMVCGTSTGGIIAALLGVKSQPIAEVEDLYDDLLGTVFGKGSNVKLVSQQVHSPIFFFTFH